MNGSRIAICAGWVLLASLDALGEAPIPLSKGFTEVVRKEVNTSGISVVAVMTSANVSDKNGRERPIYVWLPDTEHSRLCTFIHSVDGLYSGRATFDISNTPRGRHELEFQTRELATVNQFTGSELVIETRIGDDCDDQENTRHVLSSWSNEQFTDSVTFFLNASGHNATIFLSRRSDPDDVEIVECMKMKTERSLRVYDVVCAAVITEDTDIENSWLEISRYGERLNWEPVSGWL